MPFIKTASGYLNAEIIARVEPQKGGGDMIMLAADGEVLDFIDADDFARQIAKPAPGASTEEVVATMIALLGSIGAVVAGAAPTDAG